MLEIGKGSEMKGIIESKTEMAGFKQIRPESSITLKESKNFWDNLFKNEISEHRTTDTKAELTNMEKNHIIPRNGGKWSGEPGNSNWKPDFEVVPGDRNGTNPENKQWNRIMKEYGFSEIPFKEGVPDFSKVAKAEVEIEDFSDARDANFDQADEKLAEQKGETPEAIAKWRGEHKYTWHECENCKTMQLVPTEVHGNISHSGGVSVYKYYH